MNTAHEKVWSTKSADYIMSEQNGLKSNTDVGTTIHLQIPMYNMLKVNHISHNILDYFQRKGSIIIDRNFHGIIRLKLPLTFAKH